MEYSSEDSVTSVFGGASSFEKLSGADLMDALNFGGGPGELGAAKILLRAATAALLNACHEDVNYPWTESEIIDAVNDALMGTRQEMISLAEELDDLNNAFECPLSGGPGF